MGPSSILTRTALSALSVLLFIGAFGQHVRPPMPTPQGERQYATGDALRSEVMTAEPIGVAGQDVPFTRWANKVTKIGARAHGLPEVAAVKAAKLEGKFDRHDPGADSWGLTKNLQPNIIAGFEANWSLQQTPPDNAIAISNGGKIVTANNDEILYMETNGELVQYFSWADFFDDTQLNANIYDPKVIYDSQADRFILTILHGNTANSSLVLVCFSKSNDPTDGWWVYSLPGNVLNNNTWFDYPGLAVSNNEVFITGNLFTSGNDQFDQVLIFQIGKAQGYAGNQLNWNYWAGITPTPYPAFTLMPASWGQQGNYGPGMLFVSNAPGQASSLRIFEITNDLGSDPQFNAYNVNVQPYSVGADAAQLGSQDLLSTGDCRIMNSFFLGQFLHYVYMVDVGGSWNGFRYGRINVTNLAVQEVPLGNQGTSDLAYPAVASFSMDQNDPSVMVAFTRSSPAIHPEARVVLCDANMQWSDSPLVKDGETFVNFMQGTERWGDYSGIARRHNAPEPTVWMAACYGGNIQGQANNTWKTWVAGITSGSVSVEEHQDNETDLRLFPNPALDMFQLAFELDQRTPLRIELIDVRGALVKLLYEDTRQAGEYLLTFNRGALASGTYKILLRTPEKTIGHETLLVD